MRSVITYGMNTDEEMMSKRKEKQKKLNKMDN